MRVFQTYQELEQAVASGTFLFKPEYGPAKFVCGRCGNAKPLNTDSMGGNGYGTDGKVPRFVCYECCGELDIAALIKHGKGHMYYNQKENTVSNWPGTLRVAARPETGTRTLARFSFMLPGDPIRWLGSMRDDGAGEIARVWRSKR